jgi:hypothetical protein
MAMAGLIASLLGGFRHDESEGAPEVLAAVERAVHRVEPRLMLSGGYPSRYRKPVAYALDYVRRLAGQVPGPVALDQGQYVTNPLVHAWFGSPEHIRRTLGMSSAIGEYARDIGDREIYALLSMRRYVKMGFGMETVGQLVRRDVRQQAVVFSDHVLSVPAVTEAESRELLARHLFDSLVVRVCDRVEEVRREKARLDEEKDLLFARLRYAAADTRTRIRRELDTVLARLREKVEALDLRRCGRDFDAILLHPERYERVESVRFTLDGMGIVRRGGGAGVRHELDFTDLYGLDRFPWTVALVRFRPSALPPMAERLEQAQRWLTP